MEFSPKIINKYLGRCEDEKVEVEVTENVICKEIIAGQVTQWPRKKKLSMSYLSVKYVVLNWIEATNWVPTYHTSSITTGLGKFIYTIGPKIKFDFGTEIFERTIKHAHCFAVKMPIAFPTLICGIMFNQYPRIMNDTNTTSKRESLLSLYYKLFIGTYMSQKLSQHLGRKMLIKLLKRE